MGLLAKGLEETQQGCGPEQFQSLNVRLNPKPKPQNLLLPQLGVFLLDYE